MLEKQINKLAADRTKLIDGIVKVLDKQAQTGQEELLRRVVTDLVDKMDLDNGNIINNGKNRRLLILLDEVYGKFVASSGLATVKTIVDSVQEIVNFNSNYFQGFAEPAKLAPLNKKVTDTVSAWLGIDEKGKLAQNGYLDTLVKDNTIKNEIRNQLATSIISQKGPAEAKRNLEDYIIGKPEETGALQKYYRNFVTDTFSQVDRANADMIAEGLGFEHAIYEGGIIKTTRPFCRARNGKVFTREEIAAFDPPTAKPPGYNPFTDLGGYACRHHLNWIPKALALALRPDLADGEAPGQVEIPPKEEEKPKAAPKPKKEQGPTTKVSELKSSDQFNKHVNNFMKEKTGYDFNVSLDLKALPRDQAVKYVAQLEKLASDYKPFTGYEKIGELVFKSTDKSFGGVTTSNNGLNIVKMNFGNRVAAGGARDLNLNDTVYRGKSRVDAKNLDISTLTHEFAHFITMDFQQDSGKDSRVNSFWPEVQKLKTDYHAELKTISAKGRPRMVNEFYLGHYASTNLNEFMAEAFTEYKLSSKPSKYAKLVGKTIDKYFKR